MLVIGGASTNSRSPERMLTYHRATSFKGNKVRLEDQRKYIDWSCGLHGAIFGANPVALYDALNMGTANGPPSSIVHRDEYIAAEMLAQLCPHLADKAVRWMCNGSDPCSAATKLSRAITGRESIISNGYHGFGGTFASPPTDFDSDDNRRGSYQAQRESYIPLEWLGKLPSESDFRRASAVIVECPPTKFQNPEAKSWLRELFSIAQSHGALTILDEVVTGFRYQADGASGYYSLHDKVNMWCFGKTIGNGHAVSAIIGHVDIMQELTKGVHFSATFFGHPLGLSMVKGTMRLLIESPPWDHLYDIGGYLKGRWNELALSWRMIGHPTRPVLEGPDEGLDDLRRHLFREGHIVVKHPWYVTTATMREDVDSLIEAVKKWQN